MSGGDGAGGMSAGGVQPRVSECDNGGETLDQVAEGLFIGSGAAASRWPSLAACGVTHVVNAAPSVELCWHLQHAVVRPTPVTQQARGARSGDAARPNGA
jgi:hypothetical protein